MSINHNTQFPVHPHIDHQLIGINNNTLVIQHFNINLLVSIGWGACLFFWLMGLPSLLAIIIGPWLPPYGYNDDGSAATLIDVLQGDIRGHIAYLLFIVIMGGFAIAMTLGMSYLNLKGVKRSFSPICFNRDTQTVSIYYGGEKQEIAWQDLEAEIQTMTYTSGYVPHRAQVLRLTNLGKQTRIEGNFWADPLDKNDTNHKHSGAESLWEYIHQFMSEGPDHLKIPTERFMGIDHLDKQPIYSYDFKRSLESHWFWPIVKVKTTEISYIVFCSLVICPIKIVFFIPNLFTDWLWRKLCLKILKDTPVTPAYTLNHLENIITPEHSEQVLAKGEDSMKGNTYAEIKRRLKALEG